MPFLIVRLLFRLPPSVFALLAVLGGAFLRFHLLGAVPPGLHYDFAANAIIVNDIAFNGWRGVFITAYTGKEVLFFYTAALIFKFVGSSVFALQFAAAIYGVLGIASCYFAARELLRHETDSDWVAAFAAAILSFTFMHLVWSRYGERAVTEPFVQGLAVGFLFRGVRPHHREDGEHRDSKILFSVFSVNSVVNMILAGAFTGLAAYTYLAARLFPIPVAVALVAFLFKSLRHSAQDKPAPTAGRAQTDAVFKTASVCPRWVTRNDSFALVGVFLLSAALVFAPLGLFFAQHPETFVTRVNQLTPREGESNLLLKGIVGAAGMLFVSGEPYDRFNLPGRPIFGPLLGLFFITGLGLTLRDLFRNSHTPKLPHLFLLTYLPIFLLPTALSVHDIFPSNVRAMGLLPLLTIFPARGMVWVVNRASSFISRRRTTDDGRRANDDRRRWPSVVHRLSSVILIVVGTLTTGYSYFSVWATAPSLYYANDTDLVNAARWLNNTDTHGLDVYLSAIHYRHPTAAYLASDYASFRWFTGGQAIAIPDGPALYVFPHSAPLPEDWIAQWTPTYAPLGPDGTPDFRAYRFDSTPPLPDFNPVSGNFGNIVEITGYRVVEPGVVDFRLRVLNPPDRGDYRLVADLVDSGGYHWAQGFNDSYFSEQWQAGETILMRIKISVEIGTPPGEYTLLTAIYSPSANATLSALNANGAAAAYAAIGPISIPRSAPQPLAEPIATLNGLNLLRIDPPPASVRPGEPLPFALYWQAPSDITNNILLRTQLGDIEIESIAPAYGTYPTSQWQGGEMVIDRHAPRVRRDLPPGEYGVTVNGYRIGVVAVQSIDRQFAAPAPSVTLSEKFGGLFELIGYDLRADSIALYWRALSETETDYTLFVHALDASGQIVAQNDSRGDYPTSLWMKGEYVTTTIPIAANGNAVEIGWYVAETGERLKTEGGTALRIEP